jgi:hypothetical protein
VNNQVRYVEIRDSTGYTCYPKGVIASNGVTYLYSVKRQPGGVWTAYIGGVAHSDTVVFGNTGTIIEGVEYTHPVCNPISHQDVFYGLTNNWHRWDGTHWVTVQSSSIRNDCGWRFGGSLPDLWWIDNP